MLTEVCVKPSSRWDLQNNPANKNRRKGSENQYLCWCCGILYGESSFKTPTTKKCYKEPRYRKNFLWWLKLAPLLATYLILYWQAPRQVICQSVPPTGNIRPTWKHRGSIISHIICSQLIQITSILQSDLVRDRDLGPDHRSTAESLPHINELAGQLTKPWWNLFPAFSSAITSSVPSCQPVIRILQVVSIRRCNWSQVQSWEKNSISTCQEIFISFEYGFGLNWMYFSCSWRSWLRSFCNTCAGIGDPNTPSTSCHWRGLPHATHFSWTLDSAAAHQSKIFQVKQCRVSYWHVLINPCKYFL